MKSNIVCFTNRAVEGVRNAGTKIAAGTTALVASGAALAQDGLGSAIAGEVSGGKAEMGLVFAAVAVLIGALLVWAYVKRSAGSR